MANNDALQHTLELLINSVADKCRSLIEFTEKDCHYIDPIEHEEISAHYGATHAAASFIIYGSLTDNTQLNNLGSTLLSSILNRWDACTKLPGYHFDFNNFAVCLAYDYLKDNLLKQKIQQIILRTSDSNHMTINWLPMRIYVNQKRYQWTSDERWLERTKALRKVVLKAINADGSIEDRLPYGKSFNLQYNISSLAGLILLKSQNVEWDLSKLLSFSKSIILPDGDINYQGRGCNQIFAWGPWLYVLLSTCDFDEASSAISFLTDGKLEIMLKNDNLMLNDYQGAEQYLWWDYHYSSVYLSHFLLWLVLAYRDFGKYPLRADAMDNFPGDLKIVRTNNALVCWFNGRTEYLAEKGPSICAIWTKTAGTVFKGMFGPWRGAFGNKHTFEDVVVKNFIGLLSVKTDCKIMSLPVIRKLKHVVGVNKEFKASPIFSDIATELTDSMISLTFKNPDGHSAIFNFPSAVCDLNVTLYADNTKVPLVNVGSIRNQYGDRILLQSHPYDAKIWRLEIQI